MNRSRFKLFVGYLLVLSLLMLTNPGFSGSGDKSPIDPKTLSLEELYQVKPFGGMSARNIEFSRSDRYLAFLWNPFDELIGFSATERGFRRGYDLYIYDLHAGKLTRVTSIEFMKQFDPPEDYEKFLKKRNEIIENDRRLQERYYAQRDFLDNKKVDLEIFEKEEIEKLKKELDEVKKKKEEEEKKRADEEKKLAKEEKQSSDEKKSTDSKKDDEKEKEKELELWELREKLDKKKEKESISEKDVYPGISYYQWAKASDELIFKYRGDLFRYFPSSGKISRLTMTDENEDLLCYMHNDKGFYYSKDSQVYKVDFASSYILQLNHKLEYESKWYEEKGDEQKFKISYTDICPNDQWMLIVATKEEETPPLRQVKMMSYKERWAKPIDTPRDVTEDKRNSPTYRLILRPITTTNYGKQPDHIFEMPGGDVWFEFSSICWTEDGKHYAFFTWEREKNDLKIWLGTTAQDKKPELLFEMKEDIGFKEFYENNLAFTPDGKKLLAILNNKDGFRQPVVFDVNSKTKRELIEGNFESYPIIGFSKDSRYVFIISDKESPAMSSVYKITIADGKMEQIGFSQGMHRDSDITYNSRWLATMYGNWDKRPELHLVDTVNQSSKTLTNSHHPDWERYNFIKPEIFKFKNRQGQEIHGMIFKPEGWKPEDKRPAIVYMYGGPLTTRHTVEVDGFSSLSYMFQMIMAAKHGYVTINIDPRGQSGYGKKFSEANFEQVGQPQVEDLEDLVKHIENGFGVDNKKVGLHGWSFGGYQTLRTMFSSPDTFACGIAVASVTEWENYNAWYSGSTIGKSIRNQPNLKKYSLLPLAKNLKKPLLLIHGMLDDNVLFQDTIRVYRELLRSGKETLVDLFLDPDGDHGLGGLVYNKGVFKKFEAFFLSHLGKIN